jgi:hypothetical protein
MERFPPVICSDWRTGHRPENACWAQNIFPNCAGNKDKGILLHHPVAVRLPVYIIRCFITGRSGLGSETGTERCTLLSGRSVIAVARLSIWLFDCLSWFAHFLNFAAVVAKLQPKYAQPLFGWRAPALLNKRADDTPIPWLLGSTDYLSRHRNNIILIFNKL